MKHEKIITQRIRQLMDAVNDAWYRDPAEMTAEFTHDAEAPIPYDGACRAKYRPIEVGAKWADLWGSAWFRFSGIVPKSHAGHETVALIDIEGEGCVFVDGSPVQGITAGDRRDLHGTKRLVPLYPKAKGGEKVSLMVEGGANGMFGAGPREFHLRECRLVRFDRTIRELEYDLRVLFSLQEKLIEGSRRREQILAGLNEACNTWKDGAGIKECLLITKGLLSKRASASAPTVYSVGHAHIDLGWLWPTRETVRKGGRTFSTALRLMEEYPEYVFGASQPQLYAWVKERYPKLFARVKAAVKRGQWECQGAMWVEPDMNLAGGEALVRQCLYGKGFFKKEFGKEVRNLWLPDVFGYSAALPQILRKCGVDVFMTQKISWNETNTFPHHTFEWRGIDGTPILAHFLPTNDYNSSNWPRQMIDAERRFTQNAVSGEFLNLFGVGDGGGGPSRAHIEFGRRQRDLEGAPKFRFARAEEFFKAIQKIPREKLPLWVGELYLEYHRGTYTTQARMKKYNRRLELALRDLEFFSTLAGAWPKAELDRIWKNTLLNQFHDILPGSSIAWVYKDAHAQSETNLGTIAELQKAALAKLHAPAGRGAAGHFVVYNTLSWERSAVLNLGRGREAMVTVPSMGYTTVSDGNGTAVSNSAAIATRNRLENDKVRVRIAADGTIASIYDKTARRETLAGPANVLTLWEDKPLNFDAWDINHYYRQTAPEQAKRTSFTVEKASGLTVKIAQRLSIGSSTIHQRISIRQGSALVTVENRVDWKETRRMLRAAARPDVHSHEASYEIQYGLLRRPTHHNTSWDAAKFEVPGHRFCDLSQPDRGFAVVNDCKYGHAVQGNLIELTLLRSPTSPDDTADRCVHEFAFGYYPHGGDLAHSDVVQVAHEFNSPCVVHAVAVAPKVLRASFLSVDGGAVKIEAVKRAESGTGTVVRMYEMLGTTATVTLTAARLWRQVSETDMLEQNPKKVSGAGNAATLTFKPFEIRTLLLCR